MQNVPKGSVLGFLMAMFFVVSFLLPYGCSRSPYYSIEEGKIVYSVEVEESESINPMMKAMIPSEAICYFGSNRTCFVMAGPMGMFESRTISDASAFKLTTMISAMGKKMAMVLDKKQIEKNFANRVDLKREYTGKAKQIAGVDCQEVLVTDSIGNTYPVYFTEELNVEKPNWNTPFREIEGVLMEYSVKFGNIRMKLTAKEVINEKHDPQLFTIPEGYEIISDPSKLKGFF
jgi:hypothetical protein